MGSSSIRRDDGSLCLATKKRTAGVFVKQDNEMKGENEKLKGRIIEISVCSRSELAQLESNACPGGTKQSARAYPTYALCVCVCMCMCKRSTLLTEVNYARRGILRGVNTW